VAAGAAGFVLKQAAASELVEAIRQVDRGEAFFSAEVMRRVKGIYSEIKNGTDADSAVPDAGLTTREAEVLQLAAEGFPNKLIADELKLSVKTVEKHRQTLMNKLGLRCTADLVRHAVNKGIIETIPFQNILNGAHSN
jgi:DNA-binding NarL/FixJ family response regulator